MKKVLLGASLAALVSGVQACDTTSFTGAFVGAGLVVSIDRDNYGIDAIDTTNSTRTENFADTKKSKTAFGGQIVLGYGYQFDNNVYAAIMHESLFASKAKTEYRPSDAAETWKAEQSRKVWTPSFGVALGYVVDNCNFGIRGGVSLEKLKFEYNQGETIGLLAIDGKHTKDITMTSPYVGAYVEYKMNSIVVYGNVDYTFGKKKSIQDSAYNTTVLSAKYETKHKRSSVKIALGVKVNVNSILGA